MTARTYRFLLPLLLVVSALGLGCSVLSLPFFLFGPEPKFDPEWGTLASKEKDRKVRVVILTCGGLETRPELSGADRELAKKLAHHLLEGFKANDEKVVVVPPSKVDQFKAETPNWRTLDFKEDIGKNKFNADYVIVLEVESLTLYQGGSGNTLFRGKCNLNVSTINVFDADGGDPTPRSFSCEYPSEAKGAVAATDMTVSQFREKFLDYAAKQLSWKFTAHPTSDAQSCE
ncbi:MAG TPA: hypothetical protein VGG61_05450 [Gemmataceae bacterium]